MGAHTAPATRSTATLAGRGALTVAAALALTGGTASFAFAGVSANESTARTDCDSSCGEEHDEVEAAHTDCDDDCTKDADHADDADEHDCDEDEHDGRHARSDDDDDDHHHGRWDDDDDDDHHGGRHGTFTAYKAGFEDGFGYGYEKGYENGKDSAGLPIVDDILNPGGADTPTVTPTETETEGATA